MHFKTLRAMSVFTSAISVNNLKLYMPSGKRRFRKESEAFYNFRSLLFVTEIAEVHAGIARIFFKCIIPL